MIKQNSLHKILAVLLLASACAYPAFEDTGINARSIGVANAVICQSDTALNVFYNPAGLANMKEVEAMLGYGKRYMGLTDGSDISNSSYAFAFGVEKVGGFGLAWQTLGLTGAYQENTLTFSYGKELLEGFNMGLSLRYLASEVFADDYTALDPLFIQNAYSKTTFGADLGMLISLGIVPVKLGVTIQNAVQPDFGIGAPDKPPVAVKIGASYFDNGMTVEIDGKIEAKRFEISIGAEGWLLEKHLIVRSGFGLNERGLKEICAGLGYREGQFDFNYSFNYPLSGMGSTAGSHQTSIAIRFDNPLKYIQTHQKKAEATSPAEVTVIKMTMPQQTPVVTKGAGELSTELPGETKPLENTYIVVKGDTLKSLAIKFYNDAKLWTLLYEANKDKVKSGMLEVDSVLVIPKGK